MDGGLPLRLDPAKEAYLPFDLKLNVRRRVEVRSRRGDGARENLRHPVGIAFPGEDVDVIPGAVKRPEGQGGQLLHDIQGQAPDLHRTLAAVGPG